VSALEGRTRAGVDFGLVDNGVGVSAEPVGVDRKGVNEGNEQNLFADEASGFVDGPQLADEMAVAADEVGFAGFDRAENGAGVVAQLAVTDGAHS
jgi:hypothetical protein